MGLGRRTGTVVEVIVVYRKRAGVGRIGVRRRSPAGEDIILDRRVLGPRLWTVSPTLQETERTINHDIIEQSTI